MNAQPQAEPGSLVPDLAGRLDPHLDALDELELERVQAHILDVVEGRQA